MRSFRSCEFGSSSHEVLPTADTGKCVKCGAAALPPFPAPLSRGPAKDLTFSSVSADSRWGESVSHGGGSTQGLAFAAFTGPVKGRIFSAVSADSRSGRVCHAGRSTQGLACGVFTKRAKGLLTPPCSADGRSGRVCRVGGGVQAGRGLGDARWARGIRAFPSRQTDSCSRRTPPIADVGECATAGRGFWQP